MEMISYGGRVLKKKPGKKYWVTRKEMPAVFHFFILFNSSNIIFFIQRFYLELIRILSVTSKDLRTRWINAVATETRIIHVHMED